MGSIGVLARHSYSKNGILDGWDDIVACACAAIEAACEKMHFNEDDLNHWWGPHISKACGWSHGNGQQVWICDTFHHIILIAMLKQYLMRFKQSKHNKAVWARLVENSDIKQIAGFGSSKWLQLYYWLSIHQMVHYRRVCKLCPKTVSRICHKTWQLSQLWSFIGLELQ